MIGGVLVGAVAVLCVVDGSDSPGSDSASKIGFALTYALSVTAQLSGFVMAFTNCETTLVSSHYHSIRRVIPIGVLGTVGGTPATRARSSTHMRNGSVAIFLASAWCYPLQCSADALPCRVAFGA